MTLRTARLATIVLVFLTAGCSFNRAYLDYPEPDGFPAHATGWQGERLGPVRANEGGPIWKECTSVARGSLWVLIAEARKLGGNAIGDVRWFPEKTGLDPEAPMCKRRWGWFLVWPVLLTPVFQSAEVEAYAYRVPDLASLPAGIHGLPDSPAEQEELLALLQREAFGRSQ